MIEFYPFPPSFNNPFITLEMLIFTAGRALIQVNNLGNSLPYGGSGDG